MLQWTVTLSKLSLVTLSHVCKHEQMSRPIWLNCNPILCWSDEKNMYIYVQHLTLRAAFIWGNVSVLIKMSVCYMSHSHWTCVRHMQCFHKTISTYSGKLKQNVTFTHAQRDKSWRLSQMYSPTHFQQIGSVLTALSKSKHRNKIICSKNY